MAGDKVRVDTRPGVCPTHGDVQGTKEVPTFSFPAIVYLFQLVRTKFKPFVCPECGQKVKTT